MQTNTTSKEVGGYEVFVKSAETQLLSAVNSHDHTILVADARNAVEQVFAELRSTVEEWSNQFRGDPNYCDDTSLADLRTKLTKAEEQVTETNAKLAEAGSVISRQQEELIGVRRIAENAAVAAEARMAEAVHRATEDAKAAAAAAARQHREEEEARRRGEQSASASASASLAGHPPQPAPDAQDTTRLLADAKAEIAQLKKVVRGQMDVITTINEAKVTPAILAKDRAEVQALELNQKLAKAHAEVETLKAHLATAEQAAGRANLNDIPCEFLRTLPPSRSDDGLWSRGSRPRRRRPRARCVRRRGSSPRPWRRSRAT